MQGCSMSSDHFIQRILPATNPDAHDRARAWNEWLLTDGHRPVMKFIRWANGTTTDDDEILQEALITAYLKVERGQYRDQNVPFTAFVKKIAWYKIMEASRDHAAQVPLDDVSEGLPIELHEHERVEFWKEHEALDNALRGLPLRRSRILMLYEHGYNTAEIAEDLGIREDLVRKEKSLGLRQLRETLALAG